MVDDIFNVDVQPRPLISVEFGEGEPGTLRSSPVGSGIEPPPPDQTKGDEAFLRNVSAVYNFLAPTEERQAELDQMTADRKDVLDRMGISTTEAAQMLGYGDPRGQILQDLGFQPRTIKEDFDRFRNFMYGAQQSAYKKRAEGVSHQDLNLEEKIASFMLPIDFLDFTGLGFGVKKLIQFGLKKFGSGSNKTVIDLANDSSIVNQMSDAEAKDLMRDLQPVLGGEANVFLRYAKKPKQKKKRAAPGIKEQADVLPIRDFDESLMFGKQADAPTLKPQTTPLTKDVKKAIATKINKLNLSKADPRGPNPVKQIFDEERQKANYPPSKSPINVQVKSLKKDNLIKDEKQAEIKKYQQKRSGVAGNVAMVEKQLLQNAPLAESALTLAKELQQQSESPIVMPAVTFYNQLMKKFPDKFSDLSDSGKQKVINTLKVLKPEINNYLARSGKEVGGLKYSDETLGVIEGGEEAAKRSALVTKFRDAFPDEPVSSLYDPEDLLGTATSVGQVDLLQNPKFKFYQFLNETLPLTDLDTLFDTVKIGDPTDLANPAQKLFNQFKKVEDVRKVVSPLLRPFLERVFPKEAGDRASVQIAHTFEKSKLKPPKREGAKKQIGFDPEKFIGQGVNPDFLYLDISPYNQGIQKFLENQANLAGKKGNFERLADIQRLMEQMGVEGQQAGITVGKKRKLSTKLKGLIIELQKAGDPLPELPQLKEAIKILETSGPEGYSIGGMVEDDRINIFEDDMPEGSFEVASLKLPFFKMFGKPPVNEIAPIPIPKEKLTNPTKKQSQSLEIERQKESSIFDPTPEDKIDLAGETVEVTPYTKQPMTSVFYSDIERVLSRPDTPDTFENKQAVIDFFNKNRIKKTELEDYRIGPLLKLFDDNAPIPKAQVISQVRSAPIKGLKLHATGIDSEIINAKGDVGTRYTGYAEEGFLPNSQRERVLYINKKDLPGDPGAYPEGMFGGESVPRHEFGIPNENDTYIVGWSRLSDRMGVVPTKLEAPKTKSNIPGLTRERDRVQRQLSGLYAEAINKLNREGVRRGLNQADLDIINDLSLERMLVDYGDSLNEISPGLVDQMDELIVKARDLDTQIDTATTPDTSGLTRVAFVDEMQSDIMQKATERKQQLAASLRKIQEEGTGANIQGLNRQAQQVLDFFEKNKTVFRPLAKTEEEASQIGQKIAKLDERVDEIVRSYIDTREISPANVKELQTLLNDNIDAMLNEILEIDSSTVDKLFPDLPFKNRDEWADALVKSNLYELAYKKFVLEQADAPSYYAITPSTFVSKRYNFLGDTSTSAADRANDKARRFQAFKEEGAFQASRFKGIGMAEFYGGPKAKDEAGKHYTSTLEKILKKQAKENNSEVITMPVQLKKGSKDVYQILDQNDNLVATLTNEQQAIEVSRSNPNYRINTVAAPDEGSMTPVFAIKITKEMLEPYKTHKAMGGLVQLEDIFEG